MLLVAMRLGNYLVVQRLFRIRFERARHVVTLVRIHEALGSV